MKKSPWQTELLRFALILPCALILKQFIGYWSISLALALLGYIAFMGFKLHELLYWLNHEMPDDLIPDSSGVIGRIVSHVYRRKKNIEQSQQQQQASIQRFNEIISAIPSATVILNQNNEIEWANYPALLLLGINGQTDVGIRINSLIRQEGFSRLLADETGKEHEIDSPIDADMTLSIQIAQYARQKRLLLAHNISPHIEVQRSRKTFIANASHELRTPLTVIAGYLEFIQSTPELPDSLLMPVERALEQSANMQVLIDDLLTISRLENKVLNPESVTKIDLKQHLNGLIQTLDAGGKLEQHQLSVNVGEGLFIKASQKELDSVCYNLINNALKYSEAGSEIHITWEKFNGKQLNFSVKDHGIGIAPEHIARLTERFYRVDKGRSRHIGGTGLGLCIVKHVVERHHGYLEIHSRLGEGSTFAVILPFDPLN